MVVDASSDATKHFVEHGDLFFAQVVQYDLSNDLTVHVSILFKELLASIRHQNQATTSVTRARRTLHVSARDKPIYSVRQA